MTNPDQILGDAVVQFLRRAANAWARGDLSAADQLTAAAWRVVGDGEFCDDCPIDGAQAAGPPGDGRA